jgi:hypothetical protein
VRDGPRQRGFFLRGIEVKHRISFAELDHEIDA